MARAFVEFQNSGQAYANGLWEDTTANYTLYLADSAPPNPDDFRFDR
ncbi:hypothetical protein [Aporhodopirellula aestuarii]|uniref:Uncharacterized protein n=1 Tax=Aporhodopirellula aestuarii TaxID=2950107 RepID=A0ABT0UA03_9BACT|nr:hypothetical protein [Aporhodopirellula aestuarii]MCM2373700.1 hypothetical protein [Aporhodopirellula aestuarii]